MRLVLSSGIHLLARDAVVVAVSCSGSAEFERLEAGVGLGPVPSA